MAIDKVKLKKSVLSVADIIIILALMYITVMFIIIHPLAESPIRIILGILIVFFAPGYVILSTFYPNSEGLSNAERLVMSIGLSICAVILIGFALNYTRWGIRPVPFVLSIMVFIFAFSLASIYRRLNPADHSIFNSKRSN